MKQKILPRILLSLLGLALILLGIANTALGVVGESDIAVITSVRRVGGERAGGRPGRYTYSIGYTFTLPDGKKIDGFTEKIGDSVYLKADGTSTARVRYFPGFPYFNAMEKDTGFGAGQVVLILTGSFIIFFMNSKRSVYE